MNSIFAGTNVSHQNGFSLETTEEMETIRVWLECYQYLKIYSIWGNETLAELKVDDSGIVKIRYYFNTRQSYGLIVCFGPVFKHWLKIGTTVNVRSAR